MTGETTTLLDDRTVLLTGGNAGIGKETAIGLARLGAHVIITARDPSKGRGAAAEIRERAGRGTIDVLQLDLASLASVRAASATLHQQLGALHVLVANAGVIMRRRTETADGFETTFGVNHLGHFLLVELLRDLLAAGAPSRVVVVASDAHKFAKGGLDFDDLMSTRRYRTFRVYGRSKLANILFTRELARRLEGTGVTANAVHPGTVATRLGRDGDGGRMGDAVSLVLRPFFLSPEHGARTSVHVASAPELARLSGGYFAKCLPAPTTAAAQDDAAAARLWAASEALVAKR